MQSIVHRLLCTNFDISYFNQHHKTIISIWDLKFLPSLDSVHSNDLISNTVYLVLSIFEYSMWFWYTSRWAENDKLWGLGTLGIIWKDLIGFSLRSLNFSKKSKYLSCPNPFNPLDHVVSSYVFANLLNTPH